MGVFREYRNRGFAAIPARPGAKHPPSKWKKYQTTFPTDEEIEQWDREADNHLGGIPQVGIVTGSLSGIIVLDVDAPEGHEWLEKNVNMPVTALVLSSPGDSKDPKTRKLHYYFKHPGGHLPNQKKGQWGIPGADLRGDGGYIMAPPSRHPNDDPDNDQQYDDYRYEWIFGCTPEEAGIATAPAWLLRACKRQITAVEISDTDQLPPEVPDTDLEGVPKGRRNDTAAKLAGRWFALGLGESEVLALLLSWNLKNQPPLPEKEISKVCESIGERETRNRTARMRAADQATGTEWHVERQSIMTALSAKFGITVDDLQKITGEDPLWRFTFSGGVTCTMKSAQVFNNNLFRQQIFSQVGVVLPAISDKKGEWGKICQMISNAAEWLDVGPESTTIGELKYAIKDYFMGYRPEVWDEETRPPINYPFIYHGQGYIFSAHLLHFLKNNKDMKIILRELTQRLGILKCKSQKIRIKGFELRVWTVPLELMPPAREPGTEGGNVVPIKRF